MQFIEILYGKTKHIILYCVYLEKVHPLWSLRETCEDIFVLSQVIY